MAKIIANIPKANGKKEKKMKKSKIKMLTAAACLALVGTASAAWVYAGTATASANIGVKVASYASAGEITINNATNVYLNLDKGSVSFKKVDSSLPLSATHTAPNGLSLDSGKKVEYKFQVSIKAALANYVTFDTSKVDVDTPLPGYTEVTTAWDQTSTTTTFDNTWTSGDANDMFDKLPTFKWKTVEGSTDTVDSTLTDEEAYKTFIAGLTGTTLDGNWNSNEEISAGELVTITFRAEVVDE